MTIFYALAPEPKWILVDNFAQLAGGGKLYTYSNLNPTVPKPTYTDIGGNFPYTNPIIFDENGTKGPIYFEGDTADPTDTYYIRAYAADDTFLWDTANFGPGSGSGGGGNTTTFVNVVNYIANNVFLNNIGTLVPTTSTTIVAPSSHQGLVAIPTATGGYVGPDFAFFKNITTATDSITFQNFALAVDALAPDVTPLQYIEYTSNNVVGETFKYFQFPITQGVKNLAGKAMTFTCWVQSGSSPSTNNFVVKFRQYFGTGGSPSADVLTSVGTTSIGTGWQKLVYNFVVPSVAGKTLGDGGDDASYIQILMNPSSSVDICFTKPCLFLGTISSTGATFETNDQIDSVVQGFRTGDVRTSLNTFQPYGWVPANDGTIGSAASNATTRANIDTFPLYSYLWGIGNGGPNYLAQIYTSAGAASTFGATAIADFSANKQISITKSVGQVLAGGGLFAFAPQNVTFDHTISGLDIANTMPFGKGTPVILKNTGGALPTGLSATTIYYSIYTTATHMQLAISYDDAIANIPMGFSDNGSGTTTIQLYNPPPGYTVGQFGQSIFGGMTVGPTGPIMNGGAVPFNVTQPTTFMNVFIKL
jgi:hypothetical protein